MDYWYQIQSVNQYILALIMMSVNLFMIPPSDIQCVAFNLLH